MGMDGVCGLWLTGTFNTSPWTGFELTTLVEVHVNVCTVFEMKLLYPTINYAKNNLVDIVLQGRIQGEGGAPGARLP